MSNSTASPDVFAHIEALTVALAQARTVEDQRACFRAIARELEVLIRQVHARLGGIVDALTPPVTP